MTTALHRRLSRHALDDLARVAKQPVPSSTVNPGVVGRLLREALVETVDLPSPFPTHKGKRIGHIRITDAGTARLAKAGG